MTPEDLLRGDLRHGGPRLTGAQMQFACPVRQQLLDDLLPTLPGVPAGLTVRLQSDQRVQVQLGAFQAEARIRPDVVLVPAPAVVLDLSSQLVAWGLQRLTLPSFVKVSGKEVRVMLAEIPALGSMAELWPHVRELVCESRGDDGLVVRGTVRVEPRTT